MYGYVAGLPAFLAYFGSAVALLAIFSVVYSQVTPHHEFSLIRGGNVAATIAFLGALAGFGLVLASAAANSVSIADFLIWSAIGAVIQLLAFAIAASVQRGLAQRIESGEMAAGLWTGGVALVTGILNAACMTY